MRFEPSSFRDPSGHLFWKDGTLFRTITQTYLGTYQSIKKSGLFSTLEADGKLVAFKERSADHLSGLPPNVALILEPDILPFISYPYEWSFSQLKDAALLTLDLHITGLKNQFLLKDASAYNVQFLNGKPIFIDHLSFDACGKYPIWPAYGQFCRHFLAPLVLMAKNDPGLNVLLKHYLDGIPLPLARKIVPTRKLLSFGLFIHFLCHANSQKKYGDKGEIIKKIKKNLSPQQMLNMAVSLKNTIKKLKWHPDGTEWSEYYQDTNYGPNAMQNKIDLLKEFVKEIPRTDFIWDFGGNTGEMSRAIQDYTKQIICFDIDVAAVEKNYIQVKENAETKILPLVMDFSNPSSGLGFASQERHSLNGRGKADVGMALALLHHLAISNNLPLDSLAKYFSSLCRFLIIEFIPKDDSQVQRLLLSREDIFNEYSQESFIREFSKYFDIQHHTKIADSKRSLFLMKAF